MPTCSTARFQPLQLCTSAESKYPTETLHENMKNNSIVIRTCTAACVLSIFITLVPISKLDAKENPDVIAHSVATPSITAESLETFNLVKLMRVYFNSEESALSAEEKTALNRLAKTFGNAPQSIIELRGYIDGMESMRLPSTALGTIRSRAIAQYLTANGVPSEKILLVAVSGMADESRSANPEHRRVDIRVFTAPSSNSLVRTN